MTETQKAIEQEANNRYGSLLDIKVIGQYEAKEVVQNCINAFIAGGNWAMEEFEAGRSKSLEEKEKRVRELEEALKNLRSLCKACIKEPEQYPSYRKAKQLLNK